MKIVMFYHSLRSDWNNGNAHFLRGIASELRARGHQVLVYEPHDAWSMQNLATEHGREPLLNFETAYPGLSSVQYRASELDLDQALDGADLVIVHEWNSPELVQKIGEHRQQSRSYRLLYHDTHHRMVTDPEGMSVFQLEHYDGVLAYGRVLQELYIQAGRAPRAWTWHEAADTRVFRPRADAERQGDVVWVGNWGDDERSAELREFLIQPLKRLGARATVYGVRYPLAAQTELNEANIGYAGWVPNFEVPGVFARFRLTIHVPRRPYVKALPGIPTIRPFEALACGMPLICSPWEDVEGLFQAGRDFLIARDGAEMERLIKAVLADQGLAQELADHGLKTVRARHTCAHRVDELLAIYAELRSASGSRRAIDSPASTRSTNNAATPQLVYG
jgi:spore maturation protein CgeB